MDHRRHPDLTGRVAVVTGANTGLGYETEALLDTYEAERLPVADSVISFTNRLTRAGTLSGPPRRIRDVIIRILSHVPAARRMMADTTEEVNIGYRNSALAVGPRLRHAKVIAGEHLPHVADAALQKQLSAACGSHTLGHVVLTVAAAEVPAAAGGHDQVQVLVTAEDAQVAGYNSVIADPEAVVAQRFGLRNGGRVVIRPDGYVGAVASLDDTSTVADYFAAVRS